MGHLLYDFHVQGDFIAINKGKDVFIMFVHVLTWTLLMTGILSIFHELDVWKIVLLWSSHFASDTWKCSMPKEATWTLKVDQLVHLVSLIAVAVIK